MFKLVESHSAAMNLELAQKHCDLPASPTERILDKGRVKYLEEKLKAGLGIPFIWATVELNGTVYRVNGQHSSHVLVNKFDGKFPKNLTVFSAHYKAETEEDLALLFRQFDDRKSSRSPLDISGAYQGLYPEIASIPRNTAKLSADGINWYRREIEGAPNLSGDNVYTLFNNKSLHPYINFIGGLIDKKTPELKKLGVVAAIYGTYLVNIDECTAFWSEVARRGDVYDDSSPSTVLDSWLANDVGEIQPPLQAGNYYQGCAFAWNAHRGGKAVDEIKWKFDKNKGFLGLK